MYQPRRSVIGIAALLLALVGSPASANIVSNPDFESGDDGAWGHTAIIADWSITSFAPGAHSGTYLAVTGCVSSLCVFNNFLFQDLPTVSGQHYTLTFWAFVTTGTPNELTVSWGGNQVLDLVNMSNNSYAEFTVSDLIASSSLTRLQFAGRDAPGALFLDDVSVEATNSVPGPSGLAIFALGLLALGLPWRRCRRSRNTSYE